MIALNVPKSREPLHISYLPTRTGNPPASSLGAASAVIMIVRLPTAVSSISAANISGTRFLLSQYGRHSMVRNDDPLSFFSVANLLM